MALQCTLSGGDMALSPTVWTDPTTGVVLRFDLSTTSPGWNPQTWDILQQVELETADSEFSAFVALPQWC